MTYVLEQSNFLNHECQVVLEALQNLQLKIVVEGQPLDATSRLREHLLHGAGRRVGVIRRSIQNVFALFPPGTKRPLSSEVLADVQINLHAFVMNMYGIYDNWAWAYVLRHNLEVEIGGRRRVSLFNRALRKRLPEILRQYLSSPVITEWHEVYAKSFRDALAHRIPPYLPPAQFTSDEGQRYNDLENEKIDCIKCKRWERLEQIWEEQAALGVPSMYFLHAYTDDTPSQLVLLHPQMLSDGKAVVEFGSLFLAHWEKFGSTDCN